MTGAESGAAGGLETLLGVEVPAADGSRLRTDLFLPRGRPRSAAILFRTPYGTRALAMWRLARILALHGLACVFQDVRGRYGSEGQFVPFVEEIADGERLLRWLSEQPWFDGRWIAFGASYSSYTAAALCLAAGGRSTVSPPSGMISVSGMITPWRYFYRGGCFVLHWALPWAHLVHGRTQRRLDPARIAKLAQLPVDLVPDESGIPGEPWRTWAGRHDPHDPYWADIDLAPKLESRCCPILHLGGWFDFGLAATVDTYARLASRGAPQQLVLGPWEHNEIFSALLSGLETASRTADDPDRSEETTFPALRLLDSIDAWLLDETPPHKAVAYRPTNGDRWREAESWPPQGRAVRLQLEPDEAIEGSEQAPDRGSRPLVHRPESPVTGVGGRCWAMPGWSRSGPVEKSALASPAHNSVLRFTSRPLDDAMLLAGEPRVRLAFVPPLPSTEIALHAVLVEVSPDETEHWIADGALCRAPTEPISSADPCLEVSLEGLAHRIAGGHRLRVLLAASAWPIFSVAAEPFRLLLSPSGASLDLRSVPQTPG